MSRVHVDHADIVSFASNHVNLPQDMASEYRAQARRLREKLDGFLSEHPDFDLRKILISGSLAKGSALRSLNDIDLACYISGAQAPRDVTRLLAYLTERLKKAFPNFKAEQIQAQTYSVTVSFRGSGLDVDVVPILYNDDPDWYGDLVSQDDGSYLRTCIPRHLEFIQRRKAQHDGHFAQVARLLKQWARKLKREDENFRLKSFMIELILAHLCDRGTALADYPEALQSFFTYISRSRLREQIVFNDYSDPAKVGRFAEPVQIIDPVNPANNVARLYTAAQADAIVEAAGEAGDAIDAALRSPTKAATVEYWRKVFGSSFQV